jgi:hypothetical protein
MKTDCEHRHVCASKCPCEFYRQYDAPTVMDKIMVAGFGLLVIAVITLVVCVAVQTVGRG